MLEASTHETASLQFRKAESMGQIRPVEIDDPGCSYNPDREQHEAIVAHAVAVEVQKNIEAEMHMKAPPKRVDWQPDTDPLLEYQVRAAESMLVIQKQVLSHFPDTAVYVMRICCQIPVVTEFVVLKVEEDNDDSEEEQDGAGAAQEGSVPRRQPNKKTRTVRNKEARVKEQEAEMAAKQKVKQQRRELQNLDTIGQEISEVEQERERRLQRREKMKSEKALSEPPRLGKVKFQEAPVQVRLHLLSSSQLGTVHFLQDERWY